MSGWKRGGRGRRGRCEGAGRGRRWRMRSCILGSAKAFYGKFRKVLQVADVVLEVLEVSYCFVYDV